MGAWFSGGLKVVMDALYSAQAAIHVSWHTAAPDASGSGEYTSNGAARVPIGAQSTTSDASGAESTNDAAITSAAATGAWSAISHVGVVTAANGGTFLAHDELAARVEVALGEKVRIPAGDLVITFPVA